MQRQTRRLLLIAAIGVLALSIAAAGVDTPVDPGTPQSGTGGPAPAVPAVVNETLGDSGQIGVPPWLALIISVVGVLAMFLFNSSRERELSNELIGAMLFAVVAVLFVAVWTGTFAPTEPTFNSPFHNGATANGSGLGGDGTGSERTGSGGTVPSVTPPDWLLVAGVVLVGVGLVGAMLSLSTITDRLPDGESVAAAGDDAADVDLAAVRDAAGTAATNIEADADVDNEVYEAWHQMTDLLDVPKPSSSTPGEFADAAVAAGLDRDNVTRLTAVFEAVRYGGADPSEDREQRAIEALRRIEASRAEDR